jgi:hypothetical protein
MQQQLTLWPARESVTSPIWEQLDETERARLVLALARLITKTVQRPNLVEEDDHER